MSKRTLLIPAMLILGLFLSPLAATNLSTSHTNNVALNWSGSVPELVDFVADVESRLQKRPYKELTAQQKGWIVEQIAMMREELDESGDDVVVSDTLQKLASDFQTAIVQVEEGELACRHERRTGTRMVTQRCYSDQRLREDRDSSQAQLRKWTRTTPLGGFAGNGVGE
jgi:hypothetical protein